jgi:hypothetical protein
LQEKAKPKDLAKKKRLNRQFFAENILKATKEALKSSLTTPLFSTPTAVKRR